MIRLLTLALASGWAGAPLVPSAQATVTFTYGLPAAATVGEAIVLDIAVGNISPDKSATVDFGPGYVSNLQFLVTRPDRTSITVQPRIEGFISLGRVVVAPNEKDSRSIILSKWIEFSSPGTYSITVRFQGTIEPTGNSVREWTRNVVIEARNEAALRKACQTWFDQLGDPDAQRSGRALLALAYTKDVVAVPFILDAALQNRGIPTEEIQGLERIGGSQARGALERLSNSKNPRTAQLAKGALSRIK